MPKPVAGDRLSLSHLLGPEYNPKQLDFILASPFEVAWVGGIGAGKTVALCIDAFRHAARFKGAKVGLFRKTDEELLKNPKERFFKLVKEKGLLPYFDRPRVWDYQEGTNYCRLISGSEIIFGNLPSVDDLKNVEYTYVGVDQAEEVEFELYQMLLQRCRLPVVPPEERHVKLIANDEGDNWIRKRFLTYEMPHVRSTDPLAQRVLIRGGSFENPHLDAGARAQLMALPSEVQQKYLYATMDASASRLIPDLKVVPPIVIPPHWPRWVGVDPARSTGITCALWLTANPDKEPLGPIAPNAPHFYREYWAEHRDAEVHADTLVNGDPGRRIQQYVVDRTAWGTAVSSRGMGNISVAQLYIRAGLPGSPSEGDEWTRVLHYIEACKRGLTVSADCLNLIRQAPEYRTTERRGTLVVRSKARFHAVDAGGYALSVLPTRVTALDLNLPGPAFNIETDDRASILHWKRVLSGLPLMKNGESVVTPGMDEDEMNRDGFETDDDMASVGKPPEDHLW